MKIDDRLKNVCQKARELYCEGEDISDIIKYMYKEQNELIYYIEAIIHNSINNLIYCYGKKEE